MRLYIIQLDEMRVLYLTTLLKLEHDPVPCN